MRLKLPVAAVFLACSAYAQNTTIRTTVPLVMLPTSVTDHNGHPIYGLTASDFIVLDNGIARAVHVDPNDAAFTPIAGVVAIQTSDLSSAALAKIQKVGIMIPEAVLGANGEAAVLSFDDHVNVLQDFTNNPNTIENAFRTLQFSDSNRARMLDAVEKALDMLAARPQPQRQIIVVLGETRDRDSESKLDDLLSKTQRTGAAIYTLNYSAWLTPFTAKPEDYTPPDGGYPNYLAAFTELARLAKKNTAEVLTQATGGRRLRFETQSKLENDLIALGADIHSRYLVSFTPEQERQPTFHKLEIKIKDRPDAIVNARPGYWAPVITDARSSSDEHPTAVRQ